MNIQTQTLLYGIQIYITHFSSPKSYYIFKNTAFYTKIYSYLSGTAEKSKHFATHFIIRMNVHGWLLLI